MKVEEAIKYTRRFVMWNDADAWLTDAEMKEYAKIAIGAMKKQIPKKPILAKEQNVRYALVWSCPTCKKQFTGMMISEHCYHCGQKFMWTEEENNATD